VSYLAMAGVNEAIVQKLAGHSQISTTVNSYTHIFPESLRKVQASLPYASGETVAPQSPRVSLPGEREGETCKAEGVDAEGLTSVGPAGFGPATRGL